LLADLRPWRRQIYLANLLSALGLFCSITSIVVFLPYLNIVFAGDSAPTMAEHKVHSEQLAVTTDSTWLNFKQRAEGSLHERRQQFQIWVTNDPFYAFYVMLLVVLLGTLTKLFFSLLAGNIMARVESEFLERLSIQLHRHILSQDALFFHWHSTGKLLSRISLDIFKLKSLIQLVFLSRIQIPIQLGLYAVALLCVNSLLLASILFLTLFVILPTSRLAKRIREVSQQEIGFDEGVIGLAGEQFRGYQDIKNFNAIDKEVDRFSQLASESFARMRTRAMLTYLSKPLQETFAVFAVLTFLLAGVLVVFKYQWIRGEDFIIYSLLVLAVFTPIKRLAQLRIKLQRPIMSAQAIYKVLDSRPRLFENAAPISSKLRDWQTITVDGLGFKFSKKKTSPVVLRDVALTVERGQCVLVKGANGAGKSTLIKLLSRLYHPSRGAIYIDATNINNVDADDLRSLMAVIAQQSTLFDFSIAENIAFGVRPGDIDYDKVRKTLERVQLTEFIAGLEHGLDTRCGEQGAPLSGGQRQMISIARALYFERDILIVDEPTNNLDQQNKVLIYDIFSSLKGQTTIFLVTHDPIFDALKDVEVCL
jgi:subfamily B ATP-binding cassette protein MsbA